MSPKLREPGPSPLPPVPTAAPLHAADAVNNKIFVLILQHPQEKAEALATATLTVRQLQRSHLRIGLSWPNLKAALGREVDPKRWAVLYLGPVATPLKEAAPAPVVQIVDRSGEPVSDQRKRLAHLDGIILLDGTWSQAKTLWWRNAWFLKCARIILNPPFRSAYGTLRREPRRDSLSTIEAAALCVSTLEGRPELYARITQPFNDLIASQRHKGGAEPAPAPQSEGEA